MVGSSFFSSLVITINTNGWCTQITKTSRKKNRPRYQFTSIPKHLHLFQLFLFLAALQLSTNGRRIKASRAHDHRNPPNLSNSFTLYEVRTILKEVRPHFLEVQLKTHLPKFAS